MNKESHVMLGHKDSYPEQNKIKPLLDWEQDGLEEEWVSDDNNIANNSGNNTINSTINNTTKIENSAINNTPEWKRAYKNNGGSPINLFSSSSSSLQNLFQPPPPQGSQTDVKGNEREDTDEFTQNTIRSTVLSDIPEGSESSGGRDSGKSNISTDTESIDEGSGLGSSRTTDNIIHDNKSNVNKGVKFKKTIRNESGSLGFRFFDNSVKKLENELNETIQNESILQDFNNEESLDNSNHITGFHKNLDNTTDVQSIYNLEDSLTNKVVPNDNNDQSIESELSVVKYPTRNSNEIEEQENNIQHENHSDQSPDSSLNSTASSPFKVLQKANTYTKGKLNDLLESLGNKDDSITSTKLTDTLNSFRGGTTTANNTINKEKPELKDFISDAQRLFNDLKENNKAYADPLNQSLNLTSDSEYSESATESHINGSSNDSINGLEYSLKQHSPEPNESTSISEYKATSIKEQSSAESSLDSSTSSSQDYHQNISNQSVIKQPYSPNPEHISESESLTNVSSDSLSIPALPSSPSKKHPTMAVITPDDLKDYNQKVPGFTWDEKNLCWRSTPEEFGTGTTKVASSDDKDPFEGIDDLHDTSKGSNENWQLSEVIPKEISENDNTATGGIINENTLQGLEDIPEITRDSSGELSDSPQPNSLSSIHSSLSQGIDQDPNQSSKSVAYNTTLDRKISPNSDKITLTSSYSQVKREVSIQISRKDAQRILQREKSRFSNFNFDSPVTPRVNATNISKINTSFPDTYSSLVTILTENHPDQDWSELVELSVSNYKLSNLHGLDKLCPNLEVLDSSKNVLRVVGGLPSSILSLDISYNPLTDLVSFRSLPNLQQLNISNNKLASVMSLSGLVHLTELNIDNNSIKSFHGIQNIRGLRSLSARNNKFTIVDFNKFKWDKLEELYLSDNQIELVKGLDKLPNLIHLDLDNNHVLSTSSDANLIRKLSLNGNDTIIDLSNFKGLRELQFDRNKRVVGLEKLNKLETLTIRDQTDSTNTNVWETLCDLRRLHLSQNVLGKFSISEPFLNLQVLELSGVLLEKLPESFSEFCLNLRELDLSFNELSDLKPLVGIPKLQRLYLYKNRISDVHHLVKSISSMPYLQVLDTRENPLNNDFYPPLGANDQQSYRKTHTKVEQQKWKEISGQYEKNLSSNTRKLRTVYRGTLMGSSAKGLAWLDGATITEQEMIQALKIAKQM